MYDGEFVTKLSAIVLDVAEFSLMASDWDVSRSAKRHPYDGLPRSLASTFRTFRARSRMQDAKAE